jgi:hypothetical protein
MAPIEADIHGERIPALHPNMAASRDRVFQVMVKVQTLAQFMNRLQALGLMIGAHGHDRAGFDGAQHGNQAFLDAVFLRDSFDPGFFVEAGGTATHIVIRPFLIGGALTGQVANLAADVLGVLGKIFEQDFGGTKQSAHPFGGIERTEGAAETEAVVAAQDALDQGAELVRKDSGNVAFGQSRSCHIPAYSQSEATFPFSAKPQPKPDGLLDGLAHVEALPKAVRFWLRLCRAGKSSG